MNNSTAVDFSKIRNYLFLGLLAIVTALFFALLKPFAYPIFWAAVIAGLFNPLYSKINQYFKAPNLSTLLTLVVIILLIILPLAIIGRLVVTESLSLYARYNRNVDSINHLVNAALISLKNSPFFARFNINEAVVSANISEVAQKTINYLFTFARNLTQNSVEFLVMFIIMLYALFFFIRDGEKWLRKLMYLCPLGDKYERLLYQKFTATAQASLKGTLAIAVIQGSVGGILFAIIGVPGALLWGMIMVLLSLLPGLGSFIIWLPAAIIMFLLGQIWQGIVIVVVGIVIISTIDNLLRPFLVGKGLHMHPLLILFSTLGGIAFFGISGFIIGPIVASLFLAFWEMYEEYYHSELSKN